ncbi:MAG: DUF1232 domain-containing protein, partial [Pseudomonadales bacterium]|nr:DUF1232 domain-containing protein [Pseudomonadales bacterium]
DHHNVERIVEQASAKARSEQRRLKDGIDDLGLLLRMLKAWAGRRYTAVPLRSVTMALGAVMYFLMPLDFIPDFIFGSGFLDDLAVIGFVIQSVRKDLDLFREWESSAEEDDDDTEQASV